MTQKMNYLPIGYTCATCGDFHKFSGYIYAHFDEEIVHTCLCGSRSTLCRGLPLALTPPSHFLIARGKELDAYGERYGIERIGGKGGTTGWLESDDLYRIRMHEEISHKYPTTKGPDHG